MIDDFTSEESRWISVFQSVMNIMPKTICLYDLDGTILAFKKGVSSRILNFPLLYTDESFNKIGDLHKYHDKTI